MTTKYSNDLPVVRFDSLWHCNGGTGGVHHLGPERRVASVDFVEEGYLDGVLVDGAAVLVVKSCSFGYRAAG